MTQEKESPGFIERGGYWVIGQFLMICCLVAFPLYLPQLHPWRGNLHILSGYLLWTGGLVELLYGLISLGSGLSPFPAPKEGSELTTSGAYALVRHPIYGGLIFTFLGIGFILSSPIDLIPAALCIVFFDRKAALEEKWLRDHHEGYAEYAKRTRKFLPWVY